MADQASSTRSDMVSPGFESVVPAATLARRSTWPSEYPCGNETPLRKSTPGLSQARPAAAAGGRTAAALEARRPGLLRPAYLRLVGRGPADRPDDLGRADAGAGLCLFGGLAGEEPLGHRGQFPEPLRRFGAGHLSALELLGLDTADVEPGPLGRTADLAGGDLVLDHPPRLVGVEPESRKVPRADP